jgi:hypothetical protein
MEKKDKIKSAAGSRATSANIEARLTSVKRRKPPPPPKCPLRGKDCGDLIFCPSNGRPCSVLLICGANT